ncbi:MAG: ATP12 family chaperone protein [Boseongicola sp.]
MSEWAPKRFWQKAEIVPKGDQYAILLDGRPVRTPSKRQLVVPTQTMATRIATEWEAQVERVDPATMPWTRSANSALDKVPDQRREVESHLKEYADTDLLVYRAEGPSELVKRQAKAWDPILKWIKAEFDVRMATTHGVMPVKQDLSNINSLARLMTPMSHFELTGFHDLVTISGSYILAIAVAKKEVESEAGWALSRIDEEWQIEQWGFDEEAAEQAMAKKVAFFHASDFFDCA